MGSVNNELFEDYSLEINDKGSIELSIGTNCRRLNFSIHSDCNYPDINVLQKKFERIFSRLKENILFNLTIEIQAERNYIYFSLPDSKLLIVSGSVR